VWFLKSYIKLYGPSIGRGIEALDNMLKELKKQHPYTEAVSQVISAIEPNLDLTTGKMILKGMEYIGEYDYVVEWMFPPNTGQVMGLIKQIDEALLYTGCRYTITTKR
jgi:hypothetical protein